MAIEDRVLAGLAPEATLPSAVTAGLGALEGEGGPTAASRGGLISLIAIIVLGCVGLLMLGVQPVILGGLQAAGRIGIRDMGLAATFEMLVLGTVSAVLAARARRRALRSWAAGACLMLLIANITGLEAPGVWFVLTRGLAGAGGGVLIWIAIALITQRADAPRVNAIFLGAQAVTQAAFAAVIPLTGSYAHGAVGGLVGMAALSVVLAPLLFLLPKGTVEAQADDGVAGRLTAAGAAGLGVAFLLMAGIVGLWVYVEPIAGLHHLQTGLVAFAIAASLVAQVVGAVFIVACERYLKAVPGMLVTALIFIAVIALLVWSSSAAVFVVATLVFGFMWTVGMSLLLPLLITLDPTRRAAMFLPGAQLLGASAGPLVAGWVASDANILPAIVVAVAMFVLMMAAVLVAARLRRPALHA